MIPVLFDRALARAGRRRRRGGPPTILFVGRIVPHKRQDLVIRAFARYRRLVPEARLVLVGMPLSPAYGERAAPRWPRAGPGRGHASRAAYPAERLAEHYRAAHAFLCLSEHEGFCIPLLESFHFRVPVIARDVGAVGEVVGDAGVLLADDDNLDVVAELLRIVVDDSELRASCRPAGERRLDAVHVRAHCRRPARRADERGGGMSEAESRQGAR